MGKPMILEISPSPRPLDARSHGSIENPVPLDVPAPAPVHTRILAMKFKADVEAAGKLRQMQLLLRDYKERGFHPSLITGAEELFQGHPDLLVAFNTFLPEGWQCAVPK